MRPPLLALYRQDYARDPEMYLEQLFEGGVWTAERLAPIVGEDDAVKVAREIRLPELWLYLDRTLYHWYDDVDSARGDMQTLKDRGDRREQYLCARPPKERLAADFMHFLLQFTAGLG